MNIPTEADQVTRPWGSGNSLRQCAVSPSLAPLAHERTRESLLIRGPAFKELISGLAGYSAPRVGEIAGINETFPFFEAKK